jgi:hypothetical protein
VRAGVCAGAPQSGRYDRLILVSGSRHAD